MTLAVLVLAAALAAPASAAVNRCAACHGGIDEKHAALVKGFERDIHREKGLTCAACHGGDPTKDDAAEAMDPEKGFVGAPSKADMPRFCGKCHSDPAAMRRSNPSLPVDQELKYYTSRHGKLLKAGDGRAASCADCHPPHGMRPPKDPTSSVYAKNIPRTCGTCHARQSSDYRAGVHGVALLEKGDTAAPVCNTCHGNHGATPPAAASIAMVCGSCHANNMEFFKASPMAKAWEKKGFHACATCHGNHAIAKPTPELLSGSHAVCLKCHAPASPQLAAAAAMKGTLLSVETAYASAEAAIKDAEVRGMDMEDARDALGQARMAMYQARTVVHSFQPAKVQEVAGGGADLARKAEGEARAAVLDFRNRRIGLGLATFVLTFLAGALYLRVKDQE
ncbi:MAG: cytochrome c3 family protein [Elusimicrobia bacterium]|nr:cytochrome c3 family protein [Elusimicrobiota bacterium]